MSRTGFVGKPPASLSAASAGVHAIAVVEAHRHAHMAAERFALFDLLAHRLDLAIERGFLRCLSSRCGLDLDLRRRLRNGLRLLLRRDRGAQSQQCEGKRRTDAGVHEPDIGNRACAAEGGCEGCASQNGTAIRAAQRAASRLATPAVWIRASAAARSAPRPGRGRSTRASSPRARS